MSACRFNAGWGGICQRATPCSIHGELKCVVCHAPADCECYAHLGNSQCGHPLCKEHEFTHHGEDWRNEVQRASWKDWRLGVSEPKSFKYCPERCLLPEGHKGDHLRPTLTDNSEGDE